ncbi:testis-expressed protein 47 [Synchiropus splendidus]|uniref:testis-expressed protein 47 n=1 Tax=Synchiropus splendidus TaxID=270530 RepID=UPI00237E2491|nr:testis-expressed protein 47 [Synchiropus splendidus]XP_053715919.1 testis-expressed protein 47 [Synchiropus splendidus]XP_053715928.1 testis-expressed protein 47 [Synchiropus splendidus]XP_053715936.1 testis-expressed protein 47 [Synchiropus splendidus]
MASKMKARALKCKSGKKEQSDEEEEGEERLTVFDVVHGKFREAVVLQRLIVVARLRGDPSDREKVGVHHEKLMARLRKVHVQYLTTGLLLLYPSSLLHVIETSRDVLVPVVQDLVALQQRPDSFLSEDPRMVLLPQAYESRMFKQWSYKVLDPPQGGVGLDDDEVSTVHLFLSVLKSLENLGQLQDQTTAPLGAVLDANPKLLVNQALLNKMATRDELLTPRQYLDTYSSELSINMNFGQQTLGRRPPTTI